MSSLTGLFTRGSSYYLRVVLPAGHPAKARYRNGRIVMSLGACGKREAISKGTILRAEILREVPQAVALRPTLFARSSLPLIPAVLPPDHQLAPATYLRDVFDRWVEAKPRSADTVAACKRALALFEEQTGNPPLTSLTRAAGVAFRAWL